MSDTNQSEALTQHKQAIDEILRQREANRTRAIANGVAVVGEDGVLPAGIRTPQPTPEQIEKARAAGAFDDATVPMVPDVVRAPAASATPVSFDDEAIDTVPDDLVPSLKALAEKRGVDSELRRVTIAGVSHEVIVRKPTQAEWMEHLNGVLEAHSSAAAEHNLVWICALWPTLTRVKESVADKPAMVKQIVDVIERWVGGDQSQPERVAIELSQNTTEDALAEIGLTIDEVRRLLVRYSGRKQLTAVSIHTSPPDTDDEHADVLTVVVRRPPKPVYDALVRGWRGGNKAQSLYDAALTCIVSPEEESERRSLLKSNPGLPWALFSTMMSMGGAGDRVAAKKL